MRILSGLYKNRELKTPKGQKTRPTTSKIRGSVFDILQNQIQDVHFLDLFAGSGGMGIEALSRGAASATFVERDRAAASCIRENLQTLEIKAPLLQTDALTALRRLAKQNASFDIIYIDPPYDLNILTLLEHIPPLLAPQGLIILEQSKRTSIKTSSLTQIDERHFGDTSLYFFEAIA